MEEEDLFKANARVGMMMMIFIGTLFCNLHRDANGLHLRRCMPAPFIHYPLLLPVLYALDPESMQQGAETRLARCT